MGLNNLNFELFLSHYNYWVSILLMLIGFYAVITCNNFIKKMIGLSVFQTSILLFYISLGTVKNAAAPIIKPETFNYTNPIPHVLMLTAIVVGAATLAVGLALIVRIKESYGTIEEDEIIKQIED